jgi:hypothetical protein
MKLLMTYDHMKHLQTPAADGSDDLLPVVEKLKSSCDEILQWLAADPTEWADTTRNRISVLALMLDDDIKYIVQQTEKEDERF